MKKLWVIIGVLCVVLWSKESFCLPNKYALVIGNQNYKEIPLRSPVNDANDIANLLSSLGFSVMKGVNVSHQAMEQAIRNFTDRIRPHDIALFYFSGHGVQVDGINYLLPVDMNAISEDEIKYKAVNANMVLDKLERAQSQFNIIILDACRNNPFKRFRSPLGGLASMSAPTGTLLAYATGPDSVAYDGDGRNSPYTRYLLEAITVPGLKIEETFKLVRQYVMAETNGAQVPWESSSLIGDFYFTPGSTPSGETSQDTSNESILEAQDYYQGATTSELAPIQLGSEWNSAVLEPIAEKMFQACIASPWYESFTSATRRKPVISIGTVVNSTDVWIDTGLLTNRLEMFFINSGTVRLVAGGAFADEIRELRNTYSQTAPSEAKKRFSSEEILPDFIVQGTLNVAISSRRSRSYQISLELVGLSQGRIFWIGKQVIETKS